MNEEALEHRQPRQTMADTLVNPEFWYESFQNWQSEFLSIAAARRQNRRARRKPEQRERDPAAPAAAQCDARAPPDRHRVCLADRDEHSGIRRLPCIPPSTSRHTLARRSPRMRRRRSGRGMRTSLAATSRSCRASRSRVPCVRRSPAERHANAGSASPAPAGRPRALRHRAAYVARPARSFRRRRYRHDIAQPAARRQRVRGEEPHGQSTLTTSATAPAVSGRIAMGANSLPVIRRIDEQRMTFVQPHAREPRDRAFVRSCAAYASRNDVGPNSDIATRERQ